MKKIEMDKWEVYLYSEENPMLLRLEVLMPKGCNSYNAKRQWWIQANKKFPIPSEAHLVDLLPQLRAHNLTTDNRADNGTKFILK